MHVENQFSENKDLNVDWIEFQYLKTTARWKQKQRRDKAKAKQNCAEHNMMIFQ